MSAQTEPFGRSCPDRQSALQEALQAHGEATVGMFRQSRFLRQHTQTLAQASARGVDRDSDALSESVRESSGP